jgi:hypothetical protein
MRVLIYPGLDELLFVRVQPSRPDITDFNQMIRQILLLKLRESLFEHDIIWGAHKLMPESVKLLPSFCGIISSRLGSDVWPPTSECLNAISQNSFIGMPKAEE